MNGRKTTTPRPQSASSSTTTRPGLSTPPPPTPPPPSHQTTRRTVGVYAHGLRWRAQISVAGVDQHLGTFTTKNEAARAYDDYVRRHALSRPLNFPGEAEMELEKPTLAPRSMTPSPRPAGGMITRGGSKNTMPSVTSSMGGTTDRSMNKRERMWQNAHDDLDSDDGREDMLLKKSTAEELGSDIPSSPSAKRLSARNSPWQALLTVVDHHVEE